MPTVWRIKLNSGRPGVDWDAAKEYCRGARIVGLGWGPDGLPDGAELATVLEAVERIPGWAPTGPKMIRRLAEQVADGDLVWTRDRLGNYWLGRIQGGWRFDASPDAYRWDLNNVRRCDWLASPLRDYEVPGAVVRNFAGTGESLRRIKQDAARRVTEMLWARGTGEAAPGTSFAPREVLRELMDPVDVEDLVLLWLQAQGWLLLPSSRMHDTPLYEAALRHRADGRIAVVSVKSGESAPVPVRELRAAVPDAVAFAFSTHSRFTEPPESYGVVAVETHALEAFMEDRPELLPPRIAQWLRPAHTSPK